MAVISVNVFMRLSSSEHLFFLWPVFPLFLSLTDFLSFSCTHSLSFSLSLAHSFSFSPPPSFACAAFFWGSLASSAPAFSSTSESLETQFDGRSISRRFMSALKIKNCAKAKAATAGKLQENTSNRIGVKLAENLFWDLNLPFVLSPIWRCL